MGKSDQAAIRAVLAGDTEAYGELVRRHSPSIFRVGFRITGSEAEADDVVQDAFLRGFQRLTSFDGRAAFGTWIYRIAVRCALDRISRRKKDEGRWIGDETDPEQDEVQAADEAAGPERLLLSSEIHTLQQAAMQGLTAAERTAFILRHMEDCSIPVIAEVLGIEPNAAKQTVFRAVQKLRLSLAPLRSLP
jgi:RNA polymerase sigma-70 factor (ECF subfamily)